MRIAGDQDDAAQALKFVHDPRHQPTTQTAAAVLETLTRHFDELCALPAPALLGARYDKYRAIGHLEHGD